MQLWPLYLESLTDGDKKCLVPFDHQNVRAYVDTFFLEGLLKPVQVDDAKSLPTWLQMGVLHDPQTDALSRMRKLLDRFQGNIPGDDAPHRDWQNLARTWAELVVLRWELDSRLENQDRQEWDQTHEQIEDRFAAWMLKRFGSLHNLPHTTEPVKIADTEKQGTATPPSTRPPTLPATHTRRLTPKPEPIRLPPGRRHIADAIVAVSTAPSVCAARPSSSSVRTRSCGCGPGAESSAVPGRCGGRRRSTRPACRSRHSDINLTMNTYTMLQVLDQAAAVESLPPVPEAVKQKPHRDSPSQRDSEMSHVEHAAAAIDPASLPPDVARILAAWEQLPADLKARLTDRVYSATKLRLA